MNDTEDGDESIDKFVTNRVHNECHLWTKQ